MENIIIFIFICLFRKTYSYIHFTKLNYYFVALASEVSAEYKIYLHEYIVNDKTDWKNPHFGNEIEKEK